MAISSINTTYTQAPSSYATVDAKPVNEAADVTNSTVSTSSNRSQLTTAVQQALVQINSGRDISSFLSSEESQQSSANFASNLFATLPGFAPNADAHNSADFGLSGGQKPKVTPIKLDPDSSTFKLQSHIQKLITQLDSTNPSNGNEESGLGNLQSTFNTLIKSSGGEPSAKNLQSFLKLVAVNIAGSTSIGSLFSASA